MWASSQNSFGAAGNTILIQSAGLLGSRGLSAWGRLPLRPSRATAKAAPERVGGGRLRTAVFGVVLPPLLVGACASATRPRAQRRRSELGSVGRKWRRFRAHRYQSRTQCTALPGAESGTGAEEAADVIVVGSGIGGLSAAALLASYGKRVTVCEAHYAAGGAAHGFTVRVPKSQGGGAYSFDTGPSFFSGISPGASASVNPLKAVFDAIGVSLPVHTYNSFGLLLPEGNFVHTPAFGESVLPQVSGKGVAQEWDALQKAMQPLAAAVDALPVAALRPDIGVAVTAGAFLPNFLGIPGGPLTAAGLTKPYSATLDAAGVKDVFLRRWLDLLCFCLSGLPTTGTVTAEMAMMFGEFYKPTATMDYPKGGVRSIIDSLVSGLERHGGTLKLNARVEKILVEGGRAVGVQLASKTGGSGTKLYAKHGVVCGASCWDMLKLMPSDSLPPDWAREKESIPPAASFMHLHVGFDAAGLDLREMHAHYMCLEDWGRGVDAEENAALISIPSCEDDTLAPAGCGVLHCYTPATEPWERWATLERGSDAYEKLKLERAEFLWKQVERVIPDIRQRAKVVRIGTPLTHARFLRKHKGTYGPALVAGEAEFPGPSTPIPGLVLCGDSCFPGIGVPAVAASGLLAAHATGLDTVGPQLEMLARLGLR